MFLWQPLAVVDAVNFETSEVIRFKSGKLMYVRRYSFYRDRVLGIEAFKIPQFRSSPVFYSERAAEMILAATRPGLEFRIVWSFDANQPNQSPERNARAGP